MTNSYEYRCSAGLPLGPFTANQLLHLVRVGVVSTDDEFRAVGSVKWHQIDRCVEFSAIRKGIERELMVFCSKDTKTRLLAIQPGMESAGLARMASTGMTAILAILDPVPEVQEFALKTLQQQSTPLGINRLLNAVIGLQGLYQPREDRDEEYDCETERDFVNKTRIALREISSQLIKNIPRPAVPILRTICAKSPQLPCLKSWFHETIPMQFAGTAACKEEMNDEAIAFLEDDGDPNIDLSNIPISSWKDVDDDLVCNMGRGHMITTLTLDASHIVGSEPFIDLPDDSCLEEMTIYGADCGGLPLNLRRLENLACLEMKSCTGLWSSEPDSGNCSIRKLRLIDIETLPKLMSAYFSSIETLEISGCPSMDVNSLQGLKGVQKLSISDCRPVKLEHETYDEISRKLWAHIEQFADSLIALNISEFPLCWLPDDMSKFLCLKRLQISNTDIMTVPTFLPPELNHFSFQGNAIRSIDNLSNTSGLKSVDLSANPLEKIAEHHQWDELSVINLSNTSIRHIPDPLLSAKNLEHAQFEDLVLDSSQSLAKDPLAETLDIRLDFSVINTVFLNREAPFNPHHFDQDHRTLQLPVPNLAHWQAEVVRVHGGKKFSELTLKNADADEIPDIKNAFILHLTLEGLRLWSIPNGLRKSKVPCLEINDTNICVLPTWFPDLECTSLSLRNSRITDLRPLNGTQLTSLELLGMHLESGSNELASLQTLSITDVTSSEGFEWISTLKSLEHLSINNLRSKELPFDTSRLKQLESITINGGSLRKLPESIGQCCALKKLVLKDIPLNALPNSLGDCALLESIDATGSHLTSLPKSIRKLRKLERISLGRGLHYKLPDWLGEMYWLKKLEIDAPRLNNTILLDSFTAWRRDLFPYYPLPLQ